MSDTAATTTETRRQRLRRELTAEVVATARRQLHDGGRAAVSWRGIARAVGMNPASLYTYFDSLDDVFTAVILDSFRRLGDHIQAAASEVDERPPLERLLACALAYRRWALDHPAEFNLIFTDQLPDYEAPPGGPTVEAQTPIFAPFASALIELADEGRIIARAERSDDRTADRPETLMADDPSGPVGLWATMHGLVMLEINHHLPFIDDHEQVFVDTMRRVVNSSTGGGRDEPPGS